MHQQADHSLRLTTLVRENRATIKRLQADVNTLKLMLELQGLKVDVPKRELKSERSALSQATPLASW
ncbi:MAG TPA: hypothetical protein VNZ64_28190 [Candidatus Acidoferrum sp.]|nr:hypothetical protein [Candidatus Acidoferrum sp.]